VDNEAEIDDIFISKLFVLLMTLAAASAIVVDVDVATVVILSSLAAD